MNVCFKFMNQYYLSYKMSCIKKCNLTLLTKFEKKNLVQILIHYFDVKFKKRQIN